MPKLAATTPAPTSRPLCTAGSSPGAGPTRAAKAQAATSEHTKATPNTRPGCPSPAGEPLCRFQALPNSTGEYHRPPSTKLDTAATAITQISIRTPVPFADVARGGALPGRAPPPYSAAAPLGRAGGGLSPACPGSTATAAG